MSKKIDTSIIQKDIEKRIYHIRSKRVRLDRDLAKLYGVTTGNLNKTVSRNLDRFPDDFMFQLNKVELENWIFHFGTSNYYLILWEMF